MLNASAYGFVQTIARRFDEQTFHGAQIPPLLDQSRRAVEPTVAQLAAQTLTKETRALIAGEAENFSQWAVLLGLSDPSIKQNQFILNFSAGKLLEKMKVERDENQSSTDQLLATVFERTFESYGAEGQIGLIQKIHAYDPILNSWSFRVKFQIFKIQSFAAGLFSNSLVSLALSLVVAWQVRKFYIFAHQYILDRTRKTVIPRTVNVFINNAPLWAVKVANVFIAVIAYTVEHPWKVQLGSWLIVKFSGPLSVYLNKARTVLLFPLEVPQMIAAKPWSIMSRAFSVSRSVQAKLAEVSKIQKEETQNKIIVEGAPKAYQLWKHLMMHPEQLYTS